MQWNNTQQIITEGLRFMICYPRKKDNWMAHLQCKLNNHNWISLQQKMILIKGQALPLVTYAQLLLMPIVVMGVCIWRKDLSLNKDGNRIIIYFQEIIAFWNLRYFIRNKRNYLVGLKMNWNRFYHLCGVVPIYLFDKLSFWFSRITFYTRSIQHE